MKANRKFVEEKEAVSAVIGVILMVAITVAIAATVYVYVSGMLGGPQTTQEDAVITASVSGTNIRLLLTKGGQQYTDAGYNPTIFVNGTEHTYASTQAAGWVVGESVILTNTSAPGSVAFVGGTTYSVSVELFDRVVFDSNVKIP